MRKSSLVLLIIGLVVAVSLVSIWFYPSIQDFMASNKAWNGIRDFIEEFNAEPVDSLDNISGQTENEVLVCIPYMEYTQEELSQIEKFVNNGNLLLILDDFGFGNSILEYLGIPARFSNNILLDPLFNYKNQYLPRITDFSSRIKESGIEAITLNHAVTLNYVEPSQILARSSSTSFVDINLNGAKDEGEPTGPLVIAAEYTQSAGTVILVSDPSIIINTMVGQNDNYEFIRYLTAPAIESGGILLDRSHITKTPLDFSKIAMGNIKEILANRYVLLGLVTMIFILIPAAVFRKGELFG
jgi:hypothetical protein